MDYYKPSNKELIDYDYGSSEFHDWGFGDPYAWMDGQIRLTYGIHLNDDGSIPQNLTSPWKP